MPLLVCGSCGDLLCSAVTARLEVGTAEVRWSQFRWENAYDDPQPVEPLQAAITFDRGQYETELADAAPRVAELPEGDPLFLDRARPWRRLRALWRHGTD